MTSNTLSTARHLDPHTDNVVSPVTFEKDRILYSGNPVHMAGCLNELRLFFERTGHHFHLFECRGVVVRGKLAVEPLSCVCVCVCVC